MLKVHILTTCDFCKGVAYLPCGEAEDGQGRKYTRHNPCPMCEGTGERPKWVSLQEFIQLLALAQCTHAHTSFNGSMHFTAGDIWDDITETCDDCGAKLDSQTLADFILDPESADIP